MTDAFKWPNNSRVTVNGAPLGPDAGALWDLKSVIQSGHDFRVQLTKGTVEICGLTRADDNVPRLECGTGGSTGTPKIIRRTQQSWIKSFQVSQSLFGIGPPDQVATLGDLSHSLTLYATIEAIHLGATLLAIRHTNPRQQAKALQEATVLYATPSQLHLLSQAGTNLPNLRLILSGGGKLPARTRRLFTALCPNATLREFYGAAETSFITISNADTPPDSVGQAYPGVKIERRSKSGQIWVQSPYLFEGYASGSSEETTVSKGWITVGELGHIDQTGNLFLHGRKSRMFTVLDKNVFPEKIEDFLRSISGTHQCAVLGIPDPARGHSVCAAIEGPEDDALRKDIFTRCHADLEPHEVPRKILFLKSFPTLFSGKPDLVTLAKKLEAIT